MSRKRTLHAFLSCTPGGPAFAKSCEPIHISKKRKITIREAFSVRALMTCESNTKNLNSSIASACGHIMMLRQVLMDTYGIYFDQGLSGIIYEYVLDLCLMEDKNDEPASKDDNDLYFYKRIRMKHIFLLNDKENMVNPDDDNNDDPYNYDCDLEDNSNDLWICGKCLGENTNSETICVWCASIPSNHPRTTTDNLFVFPPTHTSSTKKDIFFFDSLNTECSIIEGWSPTTSGIIRETKKTNFKWTKEKTASLTTFTKNNPDVPSNNETTFESFKASAKTLEFQKLSQREFAKKMNAMKKIIHPF